MPFKEELLREAAEHKERVANEREKRCDSHLPVVFSAPVNTGSPSKRQTGSVNWQLSVQSP